MAQITPEKDKPKSLTRKILSQFDFNPLSNPLLITTTLAFAFGTAATWLIDETSMTAEEQKRFFEMVERMEKQEPVQLDRYFGHPAPPSKKPNRPPFRDGTNP